MPKVVFNGDNYDEANQDMLTKRGVWRIGVLAPCARRAAAATRAAIRAANLSAVPLFVATDLRRGASSFSRPQLLAHELALREALPPLVLGAVRVVDLLDDTQSDLFAGLLHI